MWPIVLRTYNLPPWLCKKAPYIMLGPLVDELKELWDIDLDVKDSMTGVNFNCMKRYCGHSMNFYRGVVY